MTDQADFLMNELAETRKDSALAIAKGFLGAIPHVGSLVAEVVGILIPNQRLDRIARLVQFLYEKVAGMDQSVIEHRLKTPEGVDLLEDAFHQAARALSDERLKYIASILKNGVTEEDAKLSESKMLIWLLGQLSDAEIILLVWLNMLPKGNEEFRKKHWHILEPKTAHSGSSQEELDDQTVYEARKAHLVGLGLLRPRFRRTIKQQVPEFDERTGMLKASGYDVTPLGRLLLRTIDAEAD